MARPRIFISSTFYDLRQIRMDLDKFIDSLGYEPVRNEEGDIPYGKEEELQEYCYKEIANADILISIIGGRYGTESNMPEYSISQKELITALNAGKHVFIFIEKNVASEFETYRLNKSNDSIKYKYVDNPNIYKFIEEIAALPKNNNIKTFDSADEITRYLREQFAGLFKQFINDEQRNREAFVIRDIENTAKTLRDLVDYLQNDNRGKEEALNEILKMNHPLVLSLKSELKIPYNFYVEGIDDLNELLSARGYKRDGEGFEWIRNRSDSIRTLKISPKVFDKAGKLNKMSAADWTPDLCRLTETQPVSNNDDNLPF